MVVAQPELTSAAQGRDGRGREGFDRERDYERDRIFVHFYCEWILTLNLFSPTGEEIKGDDMRGEPRDSK